MTKRNPTLNTGLTGKAFYLAKNPANATGNSDAFESVAADKQAPGSSFVIRTGGGIAGSGTDDPAVDGLVVHHLPAGQSIKRPTKYDNSTVITSYGQPKTAGKKRLVGSIPFKKPTQLTRVCSTKREFELVDPSNPFAFKVVGETAVTQLFPKGLDKNSFLAVKKAGGGVSSVGVESSFEGVQDATTITDYCSAISVQEKGLDIVVKAQFVQSADATYSVSFKTEDGTTLTPDGDLTGIANGGTETFTFESDHLTDEGYNHGVMPVVITVMDGVSTGVTKALVKDVSVINTAPVTMAFTTGPTISVSGKTATLGAVVNGYPPLKLYVDWGEGGSDSPFFVEVTPTNTTVSSATFTGVAYTYAAPGTYYVRVVAEQIVGGDRQQISTALSVVIA